MPEALAEVKRQVGADAVILHTRTVQRGGLWGIGSRPCVEVTVAEAQQFVAKAGDHARQQTTKRERRAHAAADTPASHRQTEDRIQTAVPSNGPDDAIRKEIAELRTMVCDLVRQTRRAQNVHVPEELAEMYQRLMENEVAEEMAGDILQQVRARLPESAVATDETVQSAVQQCLEQWIPAIDGIEMNEHDGPTVVALVGPTGVGKTTTVAKLAAEYALRRDKRVGLITVDTYRIAAVEQLRVYADIINVPLAVVLSPEEMPDALASMRQCDLVLIDTAGRGQWDEVKLRQLQLFLNEARPHEVHLVMSATTRPPVAERIVQAFAPLGVNRMIFTKIDEAVGLGIVLRCLDKLDARLSYVTTGQDVPDNIESGSARLIARHLMKRCDENGEARS